MAAAADKLELATVETSVPEVHAEYSKYFSIETVRLCLTHSAQALVKARSREYIPLVTYRFARERLNARAQALGKLVKKRPEVLFVCVRNAGRSQMAAALLKLRSNGKVHVRSAGSAPAGAIHPNVMAAMSELGVDLAREFPKPITDEFVRAADVVITMGCGDACPIYPGKSYEDWAVEDPSGKSLARVRDIRDEIDRRVREFLATIV